jgi:hypothetical protein
MMLTAVIFAALFWPFFLSHDSETFPSQVRQGRGDDEEFLVMQRDHDSNATLST